MVNVVLHQFFLFFFAEKNSCHAERLYGIVKLTDILHQVLLEDQITVLTKTQGESYKILVLMECLHKVELVIDGVQG